MNITAEQTDLLQSSFETGFYIVLFFAVLGLCLGLIFQFIKRY